MEKKSWVFVLAPKIATDQPPTPSVIIFSSIIYCNVCNNYASMQILDDTFASQMQQLLGNAIQEKDLEPPRSIMEVRSMLCKDAVNHKENHYYF